MLNAEKSYAVRNDTLTESELGQQFHMATGATTATSCPFRGLTRGTLIVLSTQLCQPRKARTVSNTTSDHL